MVPMEYSPYVKDIIAPMEYIPGLIALMEKVRCYEGFFFEVVMIKLKNKQKYIVKVTLSIKISFRHWMKWIRVMLPVVFEEFELVCTFLLFFSCRYHCQLVKGQH